VGRGASLRNLAATGLRPSLSIDEVRKSLRKRLFARATPYEELLSSQVIRQEALPDYLWNKKIFTSSALKTGDGSPKKREMISVHKEETKNGCSYCH